jgi:hypothetical protein
MSRVEELYAKLKPLQEKRGLYVNQDQDMFVGPRWKVCWSRRTVMGIQHFLEASHGTISCLACRFLCNVSK